MPSHHPVSTLPRAVWLLLAALLPFSGCAAPPPVPLTQTNEEGCTWRRSLGPQDPATDPPEIKQACVGPYLLEFPQNYFYEQMGADFQGYFSLALEYPSLQPFKPGELSGFDRDVAMRIVKITYWYPRRPVRDVLRSSYTPWESRKDDPAASLQGRIEGAPVFGLVPYYADLPRIHAYDRRQGATIRGSAPRNFLDRDWYITRDVDGDVERIIKCASREMPGTGIEIRDGRIYKRMDEVTPRCRHMYIMPAMNIEGEISYPRFMLERWKDIEAQARALFVAGTQKDFSEEIK